MFCPQCFIKVTHTRVKSALFNITKNRRWTVEDEGGEQIYTHVSALELKIESVLSSTRNCVSCALKLKATL